MKFDGILSVVAGLILIFLILGLLRQGVNLIIVILALLLIVSGLKTFLQANQR